MTTREWAETYHGYLKISVQERRGAVDELAIEGLSNREIADVVGIDESTVRADKSAGNTAFGEGRQEARERESAGFPAHKESDPDEHNDACRDQ